MPGSLTQELTRSPPPSSANATARLWESTRNFYNLVATGALDHRQVDQGLLDAAERCGLLAEEPRQTHQYLASGRQVGLAHPGPVLDSPPAPNAPTPRRPHPPERPANEPKTGGEAIGRRRPADRLVLSMGWARATAKQSPHPPRPPPRGGTP